MGYRRLIAFLLICAFSTSVWATSYYDSAWKTQTLAITSPSPTSVFTPTTIQDNNSVAGCNGNSWYDVLYVDNIPIQNCPFSSCVFDPNLFSFGSHNIQIHAHTINPNGVECARTQTLALTVVAPTTTPVPTATSTPAPTPTALPNVGPQTSPGPVNTVTFCNTQATTDSRMATEQVPANQDDGSPVHWNANSQTNLVNSTYFTNTAGRGFPLPASDFNWVNAAFTGSTQQILRYAACLGGMDENWLYAEAQEENGWKNNCAKLHGGTGCNAGGDCGNPDGDTGGETASLSFTYAGTTYPVTNSSSVFIGNQSAGNGTCGSPWASWGLLQSKAALAEWWIWPHVAISTTWGALYRMAKFRACVNGDYQNRYTGQGTGVDYNKAISLAKSNPTGLASSSGFANPTNVLTSETNEQYLYLGCYATHFSGGWYGTQAMCYLNNNFNGSGCSAGFATDNFVNILNNHLWPGGIVGP